jgi:hypothetical protein
LGRSSLIFLDSPTFFSFRVIAAHVNDVSGGDAVADTPDENELLEKGNVDANGVGNSKAKSSDAAKLQVSGCVVSDKR